MKRVVGLDLSLTAAGMAWCEMGRLVEVDTVGTKGKKGDRYEDYLPRIRTVRQAVELFTLRPIYPDLVVLESPSFGSKFGNPHERSGLWWAVFQSIYSQGIPIATVAPPTRAKYITGRGNSKKDVVLAHAIEWYVTEDGPRLTNDNVADAAGLAAMGMRYLGEPIERRPIEAAQLAAMDGGKWPLSEVPWAGSS